MTVCIVTGASSGIGRATAQRIINSSLYSTVVLIARNERELQQTVKGCNTNGVNVVILPFDLLKLDEISELIRNIYENYGEITGLINVSGYTEPASLFDTSLSNIEKTFSLNVFSVLLMIREVARYMKATGGKIVNVASTAGSSARPGWLTYAASKASIISASKTLSVELAEYDIKVFCVSPGRCATPLRRVLAPEEDQTKIMQPDSVAKVIFNMLADDEVVLDGQDIIVRKILK